MKKFTVLPLIAALAFFVSCQKPQTEEEKRVEVERQVQERLAAERVQDEKQRLAQDQANLEAREKALADRESAAARTPAKQPAAVATPRTVRDRSETRAETRSTASYGMFYRKLEPHGAWRETADYGYVWQPRVAEGSRDWRPYTEGRWVYSDAGWTWVSDEAFGWATYHYGRWLRLRRVGWVWVPGDEWAPAWVSWRTSRNYVGWAPLPPEARFDRRSGIHAWADSYYDIGPDQYAFVPNNEFSSQHVRRAVVPSERNVTIVIETTNVTNITYANTTIVNEGPNYEEMRSRSQQPIERYRLKRQLQLNVEFGPGTVRGDELEVSAPPIVEVPEMPRPRTLKERVTEVSIDNGWTAIADRSAAERARTKMNADATPPPNAPPKIFVKPTETSTATTSPAATTAATTTSTASVTPAATPTAAPSATATTAPSATPTATATTAASATPAASPSVNARPSPSPTTAPSATPTATATTAASATPAASPSVKARPSPSPTTASSSTPTATATTAAVSATPVASPSVKMSPSPSAPPKVSPSIAPSLAPSPSATVAVSPSASATVPVPPVAPKVDSPPVRVRPSPSIPMRATPSIAPAASASPSSPVESIPTPLPTSTKRPVAPPRAPLPTPVATPPADETAAGMTPARSIPTRSLPPAPLVPLTPSVTTNPDATPVSSPTPIEDKAKNHRPKRPDVDTETGTPTPSPSTPPD